MYDVALSMAGSMTRTHDYAKHDEENYRIVTASNLYGRYTPPIKRAFEEGWFLRPRAGWSMQAGYKKRIHQPDAGCFRNGNIVSLPRQLCD